MTEKKSTTRKTRTKNRQQTDAKIRYLVQRNNNSGDVIIEIPAKWKLTFSSVNPQSQGHRGYNEGYCLRIYEGEKLRTVMGDVLGFRDLTIPLAKKFEKESGQATWSRDSEGNFEENRKLELNSGYVVENEADPFVDGEVVEDD